MASRQANTPIELWPKVFNILTEIKQVSAMGGPQFQEDLSKAVEVETSILEFLGNKNIGAMAGSGGMPGPGPAPGPGMPGAGPMGPMNVHPRAAMAATSPRQAPYGAPGAAGGAPNLDELRRLRP